MTKTTNYQLNQWAKSDRIMMDDFNADNQKIDAALAGGAKIATGSYTGTGKYGASHPNTLTFDFAPKFIYVYRSGSYLTYAFPAVAGQGTSVVYHQVGEFDNKVINLSWNGNSVSWYCTADVYCQLNNSGSTYCYFAIG